MPLRHGAVFFLLLYACPPRFAQEDFRIAQILQDEAPKKTFEDDSNDGIMGKVDSRTISSSSTVAQYGDDFGKMGNYIESPKITVDWSCYAKHGTDRMQQRGITHDMVDEIVKHGKVLSQDNGKKYAFITQEGVVILSKDGKLITAWSKENFDSNMIDIIKKLFGNR